MSEHRPDRIVDNPFFSDDETAQPLLETIGIQHVDELFSCIPADIQEQAGVDLPAGLDEWDIERRLGSMAARNRVWPAHSSWVGAGAYRYPAPSAIDDAIRRAEFLTSYTPYQPEISQGSLQALFEYQTIVAHLMGMDISNGSIYDGPTALAEAVKMGLRVKRKANTVWVSDALPRTCLDVIDTYLREIDVTLGTVHFDTENGTLDLTEVGENDVLAVGYPNALGVFEDLTAARAAVPEGFLVSYTPDPHALALVKEPGAYDVDVATGEGQAFGIPLSFGGPYLGLFASRQKFLRQMPGRVAGFTHDQDGKPGFVLTLSTREQHIRREKATSNICSNQGLLTIAFAVYSATLGWQGLQQIARRSASYRQQLEATLDRLGIAWNKVGVRYNEVMVTDERADAIAAALAGQDIQFGLPAARVTRHPQARGRIVCAPALARPDDVDSLCAALEAAV